MWKTAAGSTGRLLQLCIGYFFFYVLTGIFAKVFTGGYPLRMPELSYLVSNTLGGSAIAVLVVFAARWLPLKSNRLVKWGPFTVPSEVAYIIPSGICTAIVIPGTTLMYTLKGVSVMVAMVIMRGCIIVVSRMVDAIQIRQGILKKRVYAEENWAVLFALLAVATNLLLLPLVNALAARGIPAPEWLGIKPSAAGGGFDLFHAVVLCLYLTAYMIRIYIMNYFKNTRGKGVPLDNQGFFAVEQISACISMLALVALFYFAAPALGWRGPLLQDFRSAVQHLDVRAVLAGVPFGIVAFFSVFIFMFKGRTATFAGLVNRLTSLLAGTAATLFMFFVFHSSFPSAQDWVSVVFILVAVYFLTRAERLRTAELARSAALEPAR
ncbi:MAG TPA: hypothetical protein VMS93_00925 [Candidatus Saccharimonadales bacterium]|nr:hypothetical protein [Candidatus Saccharimonadales bacterium]